GPMLLTSVTAPIHEPRGPAFQGRFGLVKRAGIGGRRVRLLVRRLTGEHRRFAAPSSGAEGDVVVVALAREGAGRIIIREAVRRRACGLEDLRVRFALRGCLPFCVMVLARAGGRPARAATAGRSSVGRVTGALNVVGAARGALVEIVVLCRVEGRI